MSNLALSSNIVSAQIGYLLEEGDFSTVGANLPQSIAIFAEGTHAKQATMPLVPTEVTSLSQVGSLYGLGSPIYLAARKFFPLNAPAVNCPVVVYAQAEDSGATANVQTITPSGTATKSVRHYVVIAGKTGIDGDSYAIDIVKGDTATVVATKIQAAITNALACPVSCTRSSAVVTTTTKWYGLTAQETIIEIDTNNDAAGMTYAIAETTAGSGTPTVTEGLDLFGSRWNTWVVNGYGDQVDVLEEFEAFNGIPNIANPTGRYAPDTFKPFIAIFGTVLDNPTTVTDVTGRKTQVTNSAGVAPLSKNYSFEIAASWARLWANKATDSPHSDIIGEFLFDIDTPTDGSVPAMDNPTTRNNYVKKGCSTVQVVAGQYKVVDSVTTYHPDGDNRPSFRWVKGLVGDMNIEYSLRATMANSIQGKTIVANGSAVTVSNVITPNDAKALILATFDDLCNRALVTDLPFTQAGTTVTIDSNNPDRLNFYAPYKRSGIARVCSFTAKGGFNFG